MAAQIRSLSGDMVDQIVWSHYGDADMLGSVLDANPGLAEHGPLLPAGLLIHLPDRSAPIASVTRKLWD
ncbi:MAG: tail protein X [Rhodospirillaceae bacterium]